LQPLILNAAGPGSLANWLFFLVTFSISLSAYVLRGVYGGGWSVSLISISLVCIIGFGLLLFGVRGLAVLTAVCAVVGGVIIQRRRNA